MCGIFGLIRNTEAPHPERASAAFVELGHYSVERGRDSAGFALTSPTDNASVTNPSRAHVESYETLIDNVHIFKDTLPFHTFWDDDTHLPLLARHRVALGHTRWATQGRADSLTNASPMLVGSLVGTHNGDIDTYTVPGKYLLPSRIGTTDTEVLYHALHRDRRDRRKITDVLRKIEGRAALAWVDRHKTDRVYLARAALSPLAIAWDAEGNLYWASNPRWFRDIDTKFNGALGFHDILIVQEGTLLTISLTDAAPDIADARRFTPTCRAKDARMSDAVVWRGFDPADRDADKAQRRHSVAKDWASYTTGMGTYAAKAAKAARKTGGGYGWDMSQPGYVASSNVPAKVEPDLSPVTASSDLPNYNDRLDDLNEQAFAATAPDEPNTGEDEALWSDDELMYDSEEEAMQAVHRWIEDGADDAVLDLLRSTALPSEVENIMEEFDLSSVTAFHKFRDLVQSMSMETTS